MIDRWIDRQTNRQTVIVIDIKIDKEIYTITNPIKPGLGLTWVFWETEFSWHYDGLETESTECRYLFQLFSRCHDDFMCSPWSWCHTTESACHWTVEKQFPIRGMIPLTPWRLDSLCTDLESKKNPEPGSKKNPKRIPIQVTGFYNGKFMMEKVFNFCFRPSFLHWYS